MTVFADPRANQVVLNIEFPEALLDMDRRLKKKIPGMMRRIAMEGKTFWKTLAGQKLKSSRNVYVKAIDLQLVDDASFYLKLEGFLPYVVDQGGSAYDMKPGLLKGNKYRVIPLNPRRYINMTKPTAFATVSVNSKPDSWMHPGFKGKKLSDEVSNELDRTIIPKNVEKLFKDMQTS